MVKIGAELAKLSRK